MYWLMISLSRPLSTYTQNAKWNAKINLKNSRTITMAAQNRRWRNEVIWLLAAHVCSVETVLTFVILFSTLFKVTLNSQSARTPCFSSCCISFPDDWYTHTFAWRTHTFTRPNANWNLNSLAANGVAQKWVLPTRYDNLKIWADVTRSKHPTRHHSKFISNISRRCGRIYRRWRQVHRCVFYRLTSRKRCELHQLLEWTHLN